MTRTKMARPIPNKTLARWQALDLAPVLLAVADYAKADPSYEPKKSPDSSRWHAAVGDAEFELIITGTRFWDTRARVGGGGAVDLLMHLTGQPFSDAARRLKALRL